MHVETSEPDSKVHRARLGPVGPRCAPWTLLSGGVSLISLGGKTDVLPPKLVKSRNREIGCYSGRIALEFSRYLGSADVKTSIKFQNDWKSLNLNITASRHHGILRCIGRTVPLLKPPQNPHCHLGAVDHAKKISPTPGHTASPVLSR